MSNITINEISEQSFTVSANNQVVNVFYDGRYWCSYRPNKKSSPVSSIGITDKDTAIQWAANTLKAYNPANLEAEYHRKLNEN